MDGMPSLPSPVTSVTDQKKAPHGTPDSAQAFHSQGQDGPTLAILSACDPRMVTGDPGFGDRTWSA